MMCARSTHRLFGFNFLPCKGQFKTDGHLGVTQLIHRPLLRVYKV
jgi:hypothetical protein